jgi:hypothetical protein
MIPFRHERQQFTQCRLRHALNHGLSNFQPCITKAPRSRNSLVKALKIIYVFLKKKTCKKSVFNTHLILQFYTGNMAFTSLFKRKDFDNNSSRFQLY